MRHRHVKKLEYEALSDDGYTGGEGRPSAYTNYNSTPPSTKGKDPVPL